jgi:hypothetical protein
MTLERVRPSPVWQCYSARCRQLRQPQVAWPIKGEGEAIGESGMGQKMRRRCKSTTQLRVNSSCHRVETHTELLLFFSHSPYSATAKPSALYCRPHRSTAPPLHRHPGWRQGNLDGATC